MKTYLGKGRASEYLGSVSGNIYIIDDDGKVYYYLVNILNSTDIRIITKTSSIKKGKEVNPPEELLKFHKNCKNYSSDDSISLKEALQKKKEEKRARELIEYRVYNKETTEFILDTLGPGHTDYSIMYSGNRLVVLNLENKWKLTIRNNQSGNPTFSLISLEDDRKEYKRRLSLFISSTGLPKQICNCFIHERFTDKEALKVLTQIKKDHEAFQKDFTCFMEIGISYYVDYINYLISCTGVKQLNYLSFEKKERLYNFIFYAS